MSIITRADGITFIAQAYRERLTAKSKRTLIQEVRQLSSQHGQFVCFTRNRHRELEAIFSKEPGFLLGELIWDYFGRPDDLIYCEAIAQSAQCFLVIVRHGSVYFDNRLPCEQVKHEVLPVFTDQQPYAVYTYGDVPLRDVETFGDATFMIPKRLVLHFNHLKEPVFPMLAAVTELKLLPLPQALHSKYLHPNRVLLITIAGIIVALSAWLFMTPSHVVSPAAPVVIASTSTNDIATKPKPTDVIKEISQKIEQFYVIPGWQMAQINYNGGNYVITLHSEGGDLWYLTQWANQHDYDLHMMPEGVQLESKSVVPNRSLPEHDVNFQIAMNQLIQQLSRVLPSTAIHLATPYVIRNLQESQVTLDVDTLSPDVLSLVGEALAELPVSLLSITLDADNGLVSGKIQLVLWGRAQS